MASIRRQGRRYEIRECRSTGRGPRQYVLARFTDVLTPEILDAAEAAARRPFDREAVVARARKLGAAVSRRRRCDEARALLAALQRGALPDPRLVARLREALEPLPAADVPEHLEDAAEWVGQSVADRGDALRGLLRTADRIVRSRAPVRSRDDGRYPRFDSRPEVEREVERDAERRSA